MNFASYFFSDKIALAMYFGAAGQRDREPRDLSRVGPMVRNLASGWPADAEAVADPARVAERIRHRAQSEARIGRLHSGILRLMDDRELEGVIAHELGHVLHRDILISSVAATIAAAITMLARMAFWFGGAARDDDDDGGGPLAASSC